MRTYHIAVLPGDGIGPEVTSAAVAVLEKIAQLSGNTFKFEYALLGHAAIVATGNPIPDATLDVCRKADAILLGAVGDPMYDNNPALKVRPEQGLLKLRKSLGLYANIRPIKLFDELLDASSLKPEILKGADIVFFRELTGGIYFGEPRERRDGGNSAVDTMVYSKDEVRRIARKAFEAAQRRGKRLCSVDKANVLETSRLWRETVMEVAQDFPEVEVSHMFVDNAAMQLIRYPRQFDVVLTENMFGDILTDEASQIVGSLGMLPSASVGDSVGLYEPIHGSAPDIAGKGIANPLASILSAAMLLETSFSMTEEANAIVKAVESFLKEGFRTKDIADAHTEASKVLNTSAVAEKLCELLGQPV
jgi:3-isopropylmalate dehydrogenase